MDKNMEQSPASLQAKWAAEIQQADKKWAEFRRRADKIVKIYEDKRNSEELLGDRNQMNILWSNTETLRPALYSATPTPEVMRRNKDRDALGVTVSEVLERCLSYCLDSYDFDGLINLSVKDYVITALSTAWVVYDPEIETYEDEYGEEQEEVAAETVKTEYVHYHDFICNSARTWNEVRWVGRVHYFSRKQLKELTPDYANIPMNGTPEDLSEIEDEYGLFKKAKVYEIWDKDSGKVLYISLDYKHGPILVRTPPVDLHGFFPCPRPLLGIHGKTIHPTPDYILYQDQVDEINRLTDKIYNLTNALRAAGVYDSKFTELGALLDEDGGNAMIPVDNWQSFAQSGGIDGAVSFMPLKEVVVALQAAYEARAQAKSDLYEVTGLSDIVRGTSDPDETATAQAIKNQWGSLRIRDRQKEVQRFVRDLIRLKAEVIAEHFEMKSLAEMSGVKLLTGEQKQAAQMAMQMGQQIPEDMQELMGKPTWEEVMSLLRNDRLRSFTVNIETDSTMEPDESQEKQDRTEFLQAVGTFLEQAAGVAQAQPALMPLLGEMLTFGVRGFKVGRQLEGTIEQAMDGLKKQAAQPPQPDPVEMAKAQNEQARLQTEQAKVQVQATEVQNDFQIDTEKNRIEAAKLAHDAIQRDRDRIQRERESVVQQQQGFFE